MPWRLIAILHRLPEIVARIRSLIHTVEVAGQQFFETERQVLGHLADSRIGVMEVLATAAAPMARLALGADRAWVRQTLVSGEEPAPANTATLVERLAAVAENPRPTIRVDVYGQGSVRRFVVYVPGTKALLGGPLDMRTNVLELAGLPSPVERSVELALAKSGAGVGDRVTVVGHSLGGMVAVSLADKSAQGQVPYQVDKVVEVAAPLGRHGPIAGLKLLSIDGKGDLIPLLDGLGKPNWQGATAVSMPEASLNLVKNHEVETYANVLGALASKDGRINGLSSVGSTSPGPSWQGFGAVAAPPGSSRFFEFGVREAP